MKKTVMKINYLTNLITVMLYYYSWEDAFGGYTHYDAKGKKIGYSRDGFLGTTHYDERGREVGRSEEGYFEITHKGDFNPAVGETRDKLLRWKTQGFIGYPGTVQYREDRSDPAEVKALVELIEEIDEEMLQLEDECWGMETDLEVIAEYEKEEDEEHEAEIYDDFCEKLDEIDDAIEDLEDEYEDMMNDFECEAEDREDEIYSNFYDEVSEIDYEIGDLEDDYHYMIEELNEEE